jgi:hypothetical protein
LKDALTERAVINRIECRMLIRRTTCFALNPGEIVEFRRKEVTVMSRNNNGNTDVQQYNDENVNLLK